MSKTPVSVFLLHLQIGEELAGGISCTMNLGVSTATKTVNGRSVVFQAVNPPLYVESIVTGKYNYLCTNVDCRIMIVLNGYAENANGTFKNFEARILLDEDWSSGVANYSFYVNGEWHEMNNQKVTATENIEINDLKQLAAEAR
ncbi:MAG: DUF1842 domain-containing protein [Bacteroidota bacterium]